MICPQGDVIFDFLKKVPLFADLPDYDLDRLCAVMDEVQIPRPAVCILGWVIM
jgi:hypothetical protein